MKSCTLGLYEKAMPGTLSWKEKLEHAKAAGFDAVEISVDETDEKLARLDWTKQERKEFASLTQNILPVRTMCLSGHRRFPIGSGIPEKEQRGMEIMEKAITLAQDIGVRIIQLAGYDVFYDEASTPATREKFLQNLQKSTEMAAASGVILALETMENEFCNTIEKAMYFVREIASPYCKVYPDVGNITNATVDIAKDIRTGRGGIVAAHLKETVPGVFRDRKFGDGQVDFGLVTRTLKQQGVRMFTAEFWYDAQRPWQEELRRAHDFLRPFLDV